MSGDEHNQGILVLKHATHTQTNLSRSCCACSRASLRDQTEICLCCYRKTKDIYRSQDKHKSVFDDFYQQLYSDKKDTNTDCNHSNPTSGQCGSVGTKPPCLKTRAPHVNLTQAHSCKFRSDKETLDPCLQSCPKKRGFEKDCNCLITSDYVNSRRLQYHKCQRQLNNVPATLGIPLGYFQVYLAHETRFSEEDTEKRKGFLNETFPGPTNDSYACDRRKGERMKLALLQDTHSDVVKASVATPSLVWPTRCTDRCTKLMCEVRMPHNTGEDVNDGATLIHSIYRPKTRSKCTTRSRSRSTPRPRASSCHSSRRFSRSSTLSRPSSRPSDTEPHSGSRTSCHHVSRSPSQTTISAASDRSDRSPSIRRRIGSPCHLDRRRITSARRRPIAYPRAVSPSSSSSESSSKSGSSLSSLVTPSSSSSPSRISFLGSELATLRRSRSFVSCTNYRSPATSSSSELHNGRGNHVQLSNNSRKKTHKHRRPIQRHLIPLMPSSLYTAKYSSLYVPSRW